MPQSALSLLQDWYAEQCDGDWEHHWGITIGTLDNPGWSIKIDLADTDLADVPFPETRERYEDETTWLICTKHGAAWGGNGGPGQLERMIEIFLEWARANEPANAKYQRQMLLAEEIMAQDHEALRRLAQPPAEDFGDSTAVDPGA